uniref:DNA topoisomerase n=2 Tax=Oryza brachyantha TaxID=4533 RepID=J3LTH9_ORYBR
MPASGGGGGAFGGSGGGGGGGGGGYVDANGAVEEKACPCGAGSCLVLTSNTPRNPGRKFYRCPMRDNGGCNFFEWCDTPSSGAAPANGCSSAISQSDKSMPNMLCPCGAGACLFLTTKTGKNVGRQFFRCPANQGGSSCGFFQWCDEQLRTAAQSSTQHHTDVASSGQIPSKRSSSACFKCGQENHWAKECPNQSSDPYPDKGGRTFTSASSPDACFKCGKAGHWSRDCPTANCGSGTVTSHVKSSSTLGSWNSHRY